MGENHAIIRNGIAATELPIFIGLNIPGCTMKIINAIAEDRLLCWAVAAALVILMFELVL